MADYAATISLSHARSLSHTSDEEEEHSPRTVPPLSTRPKITTINHRSLDVDAVGGGGGHDIIVPTAKPTSRKPRGRPLGSKNKPKPPVVITRESESAMKPAVLEIAAGSDIIETVGQYARRRRLGVTVMGGSGSVSDVTLRHVTLRGPFNILSLTGTILGSSSSSFSSSSCGFGITVAGSQGQVYGGVVAGKVVAASEVVVVAATFMSPTFHRLPCKADDQSDHHHHHHEAKPMSISEGCSSTGMSMSIYGVAAPAPLNCQMSSDHVLPWGPTSRPSPPY